MKYRINMYNTIAPILIIPRYFNSEILRITNTPSEYWESGSYSIRVAGCRVISNYQLVQSVGSNIVSFPDIVERDRAASCLPFLSNKLAACSDFLCMPVIFAKHNKLFITLAVKLNSSSS